MHTIKIKALLRYLVLAFALIPAIVAGLFGAMAMSGFANDTVSQYARSAGAAGSEVVNQTIAKYAAGVSYMSIHNYVGLFANSGSATEEIKEEISTLCENMVSAGNDEILNVNILDKSGTILLDYMEVQGNGLPFFGFEDIQSLSPGQTYLSPIYMNEEDYGTNVFFIAKCIEDDLNNTLGYVVEVIDPKKLSELLSNSNYGQGYGYLSVTDGKGAVLNFDGKAISSINEIGNSDMQSVFLLSSPAEGDSADYSSGGYIGSRGSFTSVSSTGWSWVSVYPASMVSSQITTPIIISLGVIAGAAVLCVLLGLFISNKLIGTMTTITSGIREIQGGDRERRLEVKTNTQFRDIADLFNDMLNDVSMSEELHKTISDISDNMLFEWDFQKEIMYVSDNFRERFDIDPSEAQLANGKFLDKIMTEQDAEGYKRDISTLLKNKTGHSAEYQMTTKNGFVVWFALRAICITDRLGEPLRVIGVITDIDSEKKMELQLSERASYDFLSQLYNRSTFERELKSEIERNAHTRVAVLFVDVDDFKFINDRFGHSVGDEVIKYVSSCIKQRVKGSGFAGRFGGDEFVLCVTDPEQIENIESLSLDLIDELYRGYRSDLASVIINVKASIGISLSPEHGEDSKTLIAAADEAMYFVKKNGKANYHIYQPEDSNMEGLQHTL